MPIVPAAILFDLWVGDARIRPDAAAGHYFKRLTVIEMTFGDTLFQIGEVSRRMQTTAGVFA